MEFEILILVEFNSTSRGPYALPARLITNQPKIDGQVWVQYFVLETGPIYPDDKPFNGGQLKCLLIPKWESVLVQDVTMTLKTVSYAFSPLHGSNLLCVGLYNGDRRMLPLFYEAEQFQCLIQRREMMDVGNLREELKNLKIRFGEMDWLKEFPDSKPPVERFLTSMWL